MLFIPFDLTRKHTGRTIFLLPDISGHSPGTRPLAAQLDNQSNGKDSIFTFEVPKNGLLPDGRRIDKLSPDELATILAHEILKVTNGTPIIVGYSTGGQQAVSISQAIKVICQKELETKKKLQVEQPKMELEDQEFEMRNFEPVTIVLDEPDFATIARYASEKEFDKKFIEDLIAIANYVANLSSLKSLNEIKVKPLESFIVNGVEQITIFFNDVIHKAKLSNAITDDTLRNLFIQYLQTVKNKLIGVVKTGANAAPQEKLDNIHVLFTNNTARKFDGKDASASNYTGGWESHSKRVTNLDPNGMLQDQDHMNLIKGENAVIIAQQIKDIVKKELNPIELFKSNIFKEARGLMEDGVDPVEVQKAVTLIFFGLFKPRVETAAVAITQPNNMLGNLNDTLAISPTDLANSDSENPSILSIAHRQSPIRLGTAK